MPYVQTALGGALLTVHRAKHITSSSAWRHACVENEYGAKLPQIPASMGLSEQNDMCINGSASAHETQRRIACQSPFPPLLSCRTSPPRWGYRSLTVTSPRSLPS